MEPHDNKPSLPPRRRNPETEALKHRVPNIHALGTQRFQMLDELGRKLSSHSTMMIMRDRSVTVHAVMCLFDSLRKARLTDEGDAVSGVPLSISQSQCGWIERSQPKVLCMYRTELRRIVQLTE
jgi:hypothetical protein